MQTRISSGPTQRSFATESVYDPAAALPALGHVRPSHREPSPPTSGSCRAGEVWSVHCPQWTKATIYRSPFPHYPVSSSFSSTVLVIDGKGVEYGCVAACKIEGEASHSPLGDHLLEILQGYRNPKIQALHHWQNRQQGGDRSTLSTRNQ